MNKMYTIWKQKISFSLLNIGHYKIHDIRKNDNTFDIFNDDRDTEHTNNDYEHNTADFKNDTNNNNNDKNHINNINDDNNVDDDDRDTWGSTKACCGSIGSRIKSSRRTQVKWDLGGGEGERERGKEGKRIRV